MIRITATKRPPGQALLATALLAVAALLWGCTEGMVEDIGAEASRPITLRFSNPNLGEPAAPTRAGTAPPEPLTTGATVRIAAYYLRKDQAAAAFETTEPTYQATYEVNADGSLAPCLVDDNGKKIAGTATALSVRGGRYDFYAVSPARKLQSPTSPSNNYHISGIPHKEDVMTSEARNINVSTNPCTVTLNTFSRQCAQVVFKVTASPDNKLPFDELYGTNLKLSKISTAGANLIAGKEIPLTGGQSGAGSELTFSSADFEPQTGVTPASLNQVQGIILPKNNSAFDISIIVQRDNETANLNAIIDKKITFDPGKRYTFTLEIKNNESRLQMTVEEWASIPFTDGNVGGAPSNPPGPGINPGTGTTITVAEWKNIPWKDSQVGKSYFIWIDQKMANEYKYWLENIQRKSLSEFPPFNYDGGTGSGKGEDIHGVSSSCTLTDPYTIYVEETQYRSPNRPDKYVVYPEAINHCIALPTNGAARKWRMPTMIELFAMWYTCKGDDQDATDNDSASTCFVEKFIPFYYWSSSVSSDTSNRCSLVFNSGYFYSGSYSPPGNYANIRCVREVN